MNNHKTPLVVMIAALTAALLLLASCGGPASADVPVNANAEQTEPQTEEETTRIPADRTAEDVYKAHPELTPVNYDSPALLPKTEDMGQAYLDRIVFLCDSPFYWLKLYEDGAGGHHDPRLPAGL